MILRILLTVAAMTLLVADADAGPFRRGRPQPAFTQTNFQHTQITPNGFTQTNIAQTTTPNTKTTDISQVTSGSPDALDEVNAKRASRGLRPFIRDPGLTVAAQRAADFRAKHHLFGHVMGGMGDFQFLPAGTNAASAGCAAYPASYGWMSCCTWESYTYAGAAWVMGSDGKRYMHLFVR